MIQEVNASAYERLWHNCRMSFLTGEIFMRKGQTMKKLSLILAIAILFTSFGIAPSVQAGTVPATDPFEMIRLKQYEVLTGWGTYDPVSPSPEILNKIAQLDALTDGHVAGMNTSPDRMWLWADLKNGANPVAEGELFAGSSTESVAYSYSRLVVMATTYRTPGSKWYGKPELADLIIGGMDFLYGHWYNLTRDFSGANWWYLKIDIPGKINNVSVLMYDLLTPERLTNYMNSIDRYVPHIVDDSPTAASGENVGANAVWKGFRVLLSGALTRNPDKIAEARDKLSESFEYVELGDGMQADYSFLQHAWNPYNLSYGMSSLTDIVNTLYVLQGTPWYPTDPKLQRIFEWVEKAYEPFIAYGLGMGMVEGRAVARARASEQSPFNLVNAISRMISFAPAEYAPRLKSIVKTIMSDINLTDYRQYSSILDIKLSNDIFADTAVSTTPRIAENLQFPGMDRVVHRNSSFTVGLAMHSTRTKNFEANGEFKTGWNIANGMTYVYTPNDRLQFTDKFWFTVDPDKLPGTTVNTRPRPLEINGVSVDMWNEHPYMSKPFIANNPMTWTGGTDLGAYGAAGMQLSGVINSNVNAEMATKELMAKKSWFMFDDEVVALGADIASSEGSPIQTIVENRRLSPAGNDAFIVDGVQKPDAPFAETVMGAGWMHLAPMGGYYFPQPESLQIARYSRSGNLGSISLLGDPNAPKITENYLSIIQDHGANISGKSYEYVLLPTLSPEETAAYANHPDVDILANTNQVQAVRENKLGITAANFWTNGVAAAGLLKTNAKSSVMVQEQNGKLAVSLSDPTQANAGNILLEINRSAVSLVKADPRIEVVSLQPTIVVGVNVKGLKGQSVQFELEGAGAGVDDAAFAADLDMGLDARHLDIRMAVKAARSFLEESAIGYKDGQYPPAAQTELETAMAQVEPLASDPALTDAQKQTAVRGLDVALQCFKASRVQNSIVISADADTSVQFNNAAGLGTATEIMVKTDNTGWFGGSRAAFLRFVPGDNASVVKSAKLAVKTRIAEATTALPPLTIRAVADNSWSETGMTYSTMPSYNDTAVAQATPVSKNQVETQFDLTGYIAGNPAGGIVSMAIIQVPLPPIVAPDTPNNDNTSPLYRISARESGSATAPKLIIEYETLEAALTHAGEALAQIPTEMAAQLQAQREALEQAVATGEGLLGNPGAGHEEVRGTILNLMQKTDGIREAMVSVPPTAPKGLTGTVQGNEVLLQWQASEDAFGVEKYEIYRDGIKIGETRDTQYTDTAVLAGEHVYTVVAIDTGGYASPSSGPVNLSIADKEPPEMPKNLAGTVEKADILLQWTASSDNIGVAGYDIYRNGIRIARVADTQYRDSKPGNGLAYVYYIRAVDTAGNESAPSNQVELAVPADPEVAERQEAVAEAVANAQDTLHSSTIGYAAGQYPPSAKDRLAAAISAAVPYTVKPDLSEAEKTTAIRQLDVARKSFLQSKTAGSAAVPVDADTAVRVNYAENHGTATILPVKTDPTWAGGNRIALLRFIVGNNEYKIKKATLLVQGSVNDSNTSTIIPPLTIRPVADSNWSETGVTYAAMPAVGESVLAESTPTIRGQTETGFDVTDYVSGHVDDGAISLAIVQKAMSDGMPGLFYQITSKEASYSTAKAPRIEIVYDLIATLEMVVTNAQAAESRIPADAPGSLEGLRNALAARVEEAGMLLENNVNQDAAIIEMISALKNLTDRVNAEAAAIPPTAPRSVTASVYGGEVLLSWQASEGVFGIARYEVYRDGALVSTTEQTFFRDTAPGVQPRVYMIAAVDLSGNRSAMSEPLAVAAVTDPEPGGGPEEPDEYRQAPEAPRNVTGAVYGAVIQLHWEPSWDNTAVVTYAVYRNQVYIGATPFPFYTDVTVSPGGQYIYVIAAIDAAGNVSPLSLPVAILIPAPEETGDPQPQETGDPQQQQETAAPPAVEVKPADPHTLVIGEEELKQLLAGNDPVVLAVGQTALTLPAGTSRLMQEGGLKVEAPGVRLEIPPPVLTPGAGTAARDWQYQLNVAPLPVTGTDQRQAGAAVELGLRITDGRDWELITSFAEPVRLILKVDADKADLRLIGIYRQDEQGMWEYVRSRYDSEKEEIAAFIAKPGRYAVLEYDAAYTDVPAGHWAYDSLKILAARHVVSGPGNGEFKPEAQATRAEFAAMLVRALDLPPAAGETDFRDVGQNDWFFGAVQAAYAAGLIAGDGGESFSPHQALTREQMAILLVRAYELSKGEVAKSQDLTVFSDSMDVSGWALPYVEKAVAAGLMLGREDGAFFPGGSATRAETAQAVLNLLSLLDQ